jgi:hypothetical protein
MGLHEGGEDVAAPPAVSPPRDGGVVRQVALEHQVARHDHGVGRAGEGAVAGEEAQRVGAAVAVRRQSRHPHQHRRGAAIFEVGHDHGRILPLFSAAAVVVVIAVFRLDRRAHSGPRRDPRRRDVEPSPRRVPPPQQIRHRSVVVGVHGDDDHVEPGAVDPRQQPSERRRHPPPAAAADAARIEGGDGEEVLGNAPAIVGRREGEEAGAAGRGEDHRDVLGIAGTPSSSSPGRRWRRGSRRHRFLLRLFSWESATISVAAPLRQTS